MKIDNMTKVDNATFEILLELYAEFKAESNRVMHLSLEYASVEMLDAARKYEINAREVKAKIIELWRLKSNEK